MSRARHLLLDSLVRVAVLLLAVGLLTTIALTSHAKSSLKANEYFTIGCSVFDREGISVRSYDGAACLYLSNGNIIVMKTNSIAAFDKEMRFLWKQWMHAHHQISLIDGESKVLVISSATHQFLGCATRFDTMVILDAKTGAKIASADTWDFRKEIVASSRSTFVFSRRVLPAGYDGTLCEFSHINSFQEIPENPTAKLNSVFKAGNFVVGGHGHGLFLIFNRKLDQILWSKGFASDAWGFHDLRITPNGSFSFFQNLNVGPNSSHFSSLDEFDPVSGKRISKRLLHVDGQAVYSPVLGGFVDLKNGGYVTSAWTEVIEYNRSGDIAFRFTPFYDRRRESGIPFQQVRVNDLGKFLKLNEGGL